MTRKAQHSKRTAEKQSAIQKAVIKGSALKHQEERSVTSEERHDMITEAAYRIAEQHGFQRDMALDDWLQAEAEVDARLVARH